MRARFKPKKIFAAVLLILASALVVNICIYFVYPNVGKLKKENPRKTSFMEYRERQWREQGKNRKIRQSWVPLARMSPYLVKAVLIAEDDKFWAHEGFDFEAMKTALERDLKKKQFKFGGSTISQQLAKNLYLTPSRNPVRKIKEAILTWRMERSLSKRRILELYLNVAEWGDGIFGAGLASFQYYGKPVSTLGPMEAAKLAAVLPNPRRYSPSGNSGYIETRAAQIYSIMVKRGIVIPDYEEVMAEPDEATENPATNLGATAKENGSAGPADPVDDRAKGPEHQPFTTHGGDEDQSAGNAGKKASTLKPNSSQP